MAFVTISEAANLVGKTRKTIYNKINNGSLSKNSDGKIDTAELLRVFGPFPVENTAEEQKNSSVKNETEISHLETQIHSLKMKVEALEMLCNEKEKHIESLQTAMRLLENRQETDKKTESKGFFARLFGK